MKFTIIDQNILLLYIELFINLLLFEEIIWTCKQII